MIVGVAVVELRVHESQSLKEKRGVVRRITGRLRHRFNVSVAEVGGQDTWQRAVIGLAMAGSDEEPRPAGPRPPRRRASLKEAALVLRAYRSESAIYGVVLVGSLIAIAWREQTDLEVLAFTWGAVVVFWLAHVYAGTVSREETGAPRLRAITRVVVGGALALAVTWIIGALLGGAI